MKAIALALCGLTLVGLAGCGLRGDLARPAPLWGEERERYEAEQAARAAATGTATTTATSTATSTTTPAR